MSWNIIGRLGVRWLIYCRTYYSRFWDELGWAGIIIGIRRELYEAVQDLNNRPEDGSLGSQRHVFTALYPCREGERQENSLRAGASLWWVGRCSDDILGERSRHGPSFEVASSCAYAYAYAYAYTYAYAYAYAYALDSGDSDSTSVCDHNHACHFLTCGYLKPRKDGLVGKADQPNVMGSQ